MSEEASKLCGPRKWDESVGEGQSLQWDDYARQFDSMCELIPAYQENIDILLGMLPGFSMGDPARVLDLGAGTGNFICALSKALPSAEFVHLDASAEMNRLAKKKYLQAGVQDRVVIVEDHIQRATFQEQSYDLVVCVNSLFGAQPQELVLKRIESWLKPEGTLFVIDFGRPLNFLDWGGYILGNAWRQQGLTGCLKILRNNLQMLKQNRRAARDQSDGTMWTHTTEEIVAIVTECGFEVKESRVCYRGYCDLVVAIPRKSRANLDDDRGRLAIAPQMDEEITV